MRDIYLEIMELREKALAARTRASRARRLANAVLPTASGPYSEFEEIAKALETRAAELERRMEELSEPKEHLQRERA
jgi:hypothetical protein